MNYEDTYKQRIDRFLEATRDRDIEAILFYSNAWRREDARYVSGFNFLGPFNMILVTSDGRVRMGVSHRSDLAKAREELPWVEEVILEDESLEVCVRAWSRFLSGGNIGVSGLDLLPLRLNNQLESLSTEANLISITEVVNRFRMIKTPEEVERIKRSAALGDEGYKAFLDSVADGKMDYEILADVERTIKTGGAGDNFMIIGVGGEEIMAMAPPMGKVPLKGDLVLTEVTPFVDGYCSQICRTCVKGRPIPVQRKGFDVFIRSMEEAIKIIKPGISMADVARAQNDVFRENGYGEYVTIQYTRTRGHSLGLWQSETPIINEESTVILEENMTFIVHPNTYMPGVGYLVLGDTVVVTKNGVEVLTRSDHELKGV